MLRSALKKTNDLLNTDIRDLFKREGRLVDDAFLGELFAILVKTDMGAGPAARIRDRIGPTSAPESSHGRRAEERQGRNSHHPRAAGAADRVGGQRPTVILVVA